VFAIIAAISMSFGIFYYRWLVQAFPPGPVILNNTEPETGTFVVLFLSYAWTYLYFIQNEQSCLSLPTDTWPFGRENPREGRSNGYESYLNPDVSSWASAALLICLPGEIILGFYSFVAEAVLVSYIAKCETH
jgi:hypothetical protein